MSYTDEEIINVEPSLQHAVSETMYGSTIGGAGGALLGAGLGWELRNALRRGKSPLSRMARSHGHAAFTIPAAVLGGGLGSFVGGLGAYKELKLQGVPVVTKSAATMSLSRLGKIYKQPGLAARRVVPGAAGLNKTIGKVAEDHMDISMALAVKLASKGDEVAAAEEELHGAANPKGKKGRVKKASPGDDVATGEEELMDIEGTKVTDSDLRARQKHHAKKRTIWGGVGGGLLGAAYGGLHGLALSAVESPHAVPSGKAGLIGAGVGGVLGAGLGMLAGHNSAESDAKMHQWTRNEARRAVKTADFNPRARQRRKGVLGRALDGVVEAQDAKVTDSGKHMGASVLRSVMGKTASADEIAEIEARVGLNLGHDHFYTDIEEVPGRMAAGLQAALDFEGQRASEAIKEGSEKVAIKLPGMSEAQRTGSRMEYTPGQGYREKARREVYTSSRHSNLGRGVDGIGSVRKHLDSKKKAVGAVARGSSDLARQHGGYARKALVAGGVADRLKRVGKAHPSIAAKLVGALRGK